MEQFLDFVKVDTGTNLVGGTMTSNVPKDATVHELTSNTIWFIEHLYEHYNVIADIMLLDPVSVGQLESLTSQRILSTEERNKTLLGLYISKCSFLKKKMVITIISNDCKCFSIVLISEKVLSELNLTIVSKCEQYNDHATRYLFRLNNIYYILKSLQRSNTLDLLILTEPDCERHYLELIQVDP